MTDRMTPNEKDLDPQELVEQPDYTDPDDDPTDDEPQPGDPSYVEPAADVDPATGDND